MKYIKWNDETMALGIPIIDEQHKKFLNIINQLQSIIYSSSQKEKLIDIIDELIDYAIFHFKTEEDLFEKFDYEFKEEHKKEHKKFFDKFLELKKITEIELLSLRKNAIEIANEIYIFIIDWFLNHIAGTDKKYITLFYAID